MTNLTFSNLLRLKVSAGILEGTDLPGFPAEAFSPREARLSELADELDIYLEAGMTIEEVCNDGDSTPAAQEWNETFNALVGEVSQALSKAKNASKAADPKSSPSSVAMSAPDAKSEAALKAARASFRVAAKAIQMLRIQELDAIIGQNPYDADSESRLRGDIREILLRCSYDEEAISVVTDQLKVAHGRQKALNDMIDSTAIFKANEYFDYRNTESKINEIVDPNGHLDPTFAELVRRLVVHEGSVAMRGNASQGKGIEHTLAPLSEALTDEELIDLVSCIQAVVTTFGDLSQDKAAANQTARNRKVREASITPGDRVFNRLTNFYASIQAMAADRSSPVTRSESEIGGSKVIMFVGIPQNKIYKITDQDMKDAQGHAQCLSFIKQLALEGVIVDDRASSKMREWDVCLAEAEREFDKATTAMLDGVANAAADRLRWVKIVQHLKLPANVGKPQNWANVLKGVGKKVIG